MQQPGSQAALPPRDLQPRYVPTICGEPFVPTLPRPAQRSSPRPWLHEVADNACLQMDARTSAQLGEAWSRGAAMMQRACQSQKSQMVRLQAEVSEQVASMHRLATETRHLRENLEAVLRNVELMASRAVDSSHWEKPRAAEPPAGLLPVQEVPEASSRTDTSRSAEEDPEAVEDAGHHTPRETEPSRAPVGEVDPAAAAHRARVAVLRAAMGEVGLLGAPGRRKAAARQPEATAPLLAPLPVRPAHGPPAWLGPLAPCPEEPDCAAPVATCNSHEGSSRASTPSRAVCAAFSLTLRRVGEMPFGLEVQPDFRTQCLVIGGVRRGSVCEAWNRQNLGEVREIRLGDRIVAVNEKREAEAMRDEFRQRLTVKMQVERGEPTGGSTGRSTPEEAGWAAGAPQPTPACAPEPAGPLPAGAPSQAKRAGRPGRARGRGRRGRGGKA